MKNKTALQELIEWMEYVTAPIGIIKHAESLIQKEQKQITDAFDYANTELHNSNGSFITGKQYYNDTYKNYENNQN